MRFKAIPLKHPLRVAQGAETTYMSKILEEYVKFKKTVKIYTRRTFD